LDDIKDFLEQNNYFSGNKLLIGEAKFLLEPTCEHPPFHLS